MQHIEQVIKQWCEEALLKPTIDPDFRAAIVKYLAEEDEQI